MTTLSAAQANRPSASGVAGRAAVIAAPGQIRIEDRVFPEPGPHQVRVRMRGCGVCASNIPVWEGRSWFEYPQAAGSPGHEGWGTIDAVGRGVEHLQVGEHVTLLSYTAYADYEVVDAAKVIRLPPSLAGKAVPGEPLGCAMNILERCSLQNGQTMAVVGVGFLGALLIQLAARAGVNVVAVARRESCLDLARRCGARAAVGSDDRQAVQQVIEFARSVRHCADALDTDGCDVVIEATGKQGPLDLASQLVCTRGRLVIAGYHQDGHRQVNMQLWNWRGIDVINAHERHERLYLQGIERAVGAWGRGEWNPEPLLTHRFPLDCLDQALTAAASRPEGFVKALVLSDP